MESEKPNIDPRQLQEELQKAFGKVQERLDQIEEFSMAAIHLHIMTFHRLIMAEVLDVTDLIHALEAQKEGEQGRSAKTVLTSIIEIFRNFRDGEKVNFPHLHLVHSRSDDDDG